MQYDFFGQTTDPKEERMAHVALSYPMAAKANNSRASNGNSVLRLVRNRAVIVSKNKKYKSE